MINRKNGATLNAIPIGQTGEHPDAAFTLLELLVAVTLLAAISALLVGAIGNARTAIETVERTNREASVTGVRRFLTDALAQTRPVQQTGKRTRAKQVFSGTTDQLSFVTSQETPGQFAGYYQFKLELEQQSESDSSYDLFVVQSLWRPGQIGRPEPQTPKQRFKLMTRLRSLSIRYFGSPDGRSPAQWHDSWLDNNRLPQLVSLDLQLTGRSEDAWPRLIVHLQLAN